MDGFTLGASSDGLNNCHLEVAEWILINGQHNLSDEIKIKAYLCRSRGLTI
jgi:hypothetical protein